MLDRIYGAVAWQCVHQNRYTISIHIEDKILVRYDLKKEKEKRY
jgi:hypothetical protein